MPGGHLSTVVQHLRGIAGGGTAAPEGDEVLIERFVDSRAEDAFAELMRRHGPMVLGVCRRLLGHREEAEDAFQATFLILARHAPRVRNRHSLGGWLYRVAYRVALHARAGRARRREEGLNAGAVDSADGRDPLARRELQIDLDALLALLPQKYQAPLVLCHLEGRTHEEAAHQLGWPVGTVKGRLSRAQELLRQRLVRRGLALGAGALPAALASPALAAVPAALRRNTLAAAAAPAAPAAGASAQALAWAEQGLRALRWARVKLVTLLLTATVLTAGGLTAGGLWLAQVPPPADPPPDAGALPAAPPAEPGAAPGTLLRELAFPKDQVSRFALAPDGRLLAVSEKVGPRTVRISLRDPALGTAAGTLEADADSGGLEALAFSPDGRLLAAAESAGAGRLSVWEVASRRCLLRAQTNVVLCCLTFSPDGRTLFTGRADRLLSAWDVATGKELRQFKGHTSHVDAVAVSPDGRHLASAAHDDSVRLWSVATGVELRQLRGPHDDFADIAFAPDGRSLLVAGVDRDCALWEIASGCRRAVFPGHPGKVTAAAFFRGGQVVVTASQEKLLFWDADTGKELRHLHPCQTWTKTLGIDRDGRVLVTGGENRALVWAPPRLAAETPPARAWLTAAELSRHGEALEGDDAARAFRSIRALAASPDQAVPWLRERLLRAGPTPLAGVRGVEVLERIGSPTARQVLQEITAHGPPALTEEAEHSLRRLTSLSAAPR